MAPGQGEWEGRFSHPRGRGGRLQTARACPRARPTHARAQARRISAVVSCVSEIHFCHGFATVTEMTQALQISIHEHLNVSTMRRDMVNIRRPNSSAMPGTFPAERFCQQLSSAAFRPVIARVCIQAMPGSRFLPDNLWLMLLAVAFSCCHPASWVFASAKWLQHLIPPKNAKEPPSATASAVRKVALRLRPDIDDGFRPAGSAVDRKARRSGIRKQAEDPGASTNRTVEPSVICPNYTIL